MGKLNMDAIQQAKALLERKGGNSTNFDKLSNGKNLRRILWPKGTKDLCYSEGYIHFGLGGDGRGSCVCRKTNNPTNRCPICEYVYQLQKSKDKNDRKLADNLRGRKRVYFNVIDRDDSTSDSDIPTVKILAVGLTVQRQIITLLCDPDYGDITDPQTGRDITIKRSGQGLNTEYSIIPKPNSTVFSTAVSEQELENMMVDLDSLWKIPTIEEAQNLLYGNNEESDDFSNEEPNPKSPFVDSPSPTKSFDDSDDYDDLELEELKVMCEDRGIELPEKISKLKLIALLRQSDSEDDGDKVKSVIADALRRRN